MKQNRKQQIKGNIQGGKPKQKHPGHSSFGPLTPAEAHQQAASRSQAEYAPVIHAIKGEVQGSKTRQKNIGGMFNQLQGSIDQAATNTDASYSAANAAMRANIEAAAKAAEQANAGVAGQNADFAKLTGADPSVFAPSTAEANNAAAQRSLTEASLAAPIAAAGANQAAYLQNTGINARHEGIYQKLGEAKRRDKIKSDLMAARKERAQKTQANYGELAEGQRDRNLEKWKTNVAFSENKAAANASAAKFNAEQAQQLQENQENNAQDERASVRSHGKGGLTPSEQRNVQQGHKDALTAARSAVQIAGYPRTPQEWAQLEQALASQDEISPSEAAFAVNRLKHNPKLRKGSKQGNRGVKGATVVPGAP